ncbi:hypothetical protein AHAS_Ahas15G0224500 [Arachis hypogaea]
MIQHCTTRKLLTVRVCYNICLGVTALAKLITRYLETWLHLMQRTRKNVYLSPLVVFSDVNALIEEEMRMNLIRRMQHLLRPMNPPFLILPILFNFCHLLLCSSPQIPI